MVGVVGGSVDSGSIGVLVVIVVMAEVMVSLFLFKVGKIGGSRVGEIVSRGVMFGCFII